MSMIYFSHRGANTRRVQNTVSAFELAHKQGARHFELDVHLLKDGKLAVHHDYSLESTAGAVNPQSGPLAGIMKEPGEEIGRRGDARAASTAGKDILLKDLTAADLKKYPLKNPFTQEIVYVPLLQEVLPVITPQLQLLNIELKNDGNIYPGLEETVLAAVPKTILPKVLFSSFDYPTLQRLRQLAPQARIGQLTRAFDVHEAVSLRAESVHINYTRFTPQLAQICHQHQLKVYCYTVNDPALAAQLETEGLDGIFTDDVTLFGKHTANFE